MHNEANTSRRPSPAALIAAVVGTCLATGCSSGDPRSYDYFMADKIARDGALARCDADPETARTDIECANAQRAAIAVQLAEERERREMLERESTARIESLRRQVEAERRAHEEAAAAAAAEAERSLYPEEFFVTVPGDGDGNGGESAPADGATTAESAGIAGPASAVEAMP